MKHARKMIARANIRGRRVNLSWQNPPAAEFAPLESIARIHVVRQRNTFPATHDDGHIVYTGPAINRVTDSNVIPLETHYYKVFVENTLGEFFSDIEAEACSFATDDYGLADKLYKQLPAVHLRYDVPLDNESLARLQADFPILFDRFQALAPEQRNWGQLRRMFAFLALPFDALRSLAEGLPQLHNVDRARHDILPQLGYWLGWQLDQTLPVHARRTEVRFAPQRYRTVGTHTSLAEFVHRYTGWITQASEMQSQLTLTNSPSALNIFAIRQSGGGWLAVDDASVELGFSAGNDTASGAPGTQASLTSTTTEPFVLRPNMELAVTADNTIPTVVKFRAGDFADISAATAEEVAAAFTRNQTQATAIARADGRIVISSNTAGPESELTVEHAVTSLVALESAPKGRLATTAYTDAYGDERRRLFYEVSDPTEQIQDWASQRQLDGFAELTADYEAGDRTVPLRSDPTAMMPADNRSGSRLKYKTYRHGAWGDSLTVPNATGHAKDSPAAVEIPGNPGTVLLAWIEQPGSGAEQVWFRAGTPTDADRAQLTGSVAAPFAIKPQSRLTIAGHWQEPEVFHFVSSDFVDPSQATAAEVEAALNARLAEVTATALADNTIRLETSSVGGNQRIRIELENSDAAVAIGFDDLNHDASGSWGDELGWSVPRLVDTLLPGRYQDLNLVVDSAGNIWLFCSRHRDRNWEVVTTRFTGWAWTPPNLVGGAWSAPEVLASGRFGNREPFAVVDDANRLWLFWSRKSGGNPAVDEWTIRARLFDSGPGTWGAEQAVTTAPAGVQSMDTQASVSPAAPGTLDVLFRSNRNGGADLFSLNFDTGAGIATPPTTVMAGQAGDHAPQILPMPDAEQWVLYRSDRSVPLAHVGTRDIPAFENRHTFDADSSPPADSYAVKSVVSRYTGTAHRFVGTHAVDLSDTARIAVSRSRSWDDLNSYTPQRPVGPPSEAPASDQEPYTRGTVRLYVSRLTPGSALTEAKTQRIKSILEQYVPINVRVLFEVAPRVDIEYVYRDPATGRDLEDSYSDRYPFVERFGDIADTTALAAPDLRTLLTNTLGDISADVADLTSLRGRTHAPWIGS